MHKLHAVSVESIEYTQDGKNPIKIKINGVQLYGKGVITFNTVGHVNQNVMVEVQYHPDLITDEDKELLNIQ